MDFDQIREGEARVIIPKRGSVIAEDGTCRVAIIRPCVSRGARILGLPPIYTPQMLEAFAGVFRGWPMYADHLQESLEEMAGLLPDDLQEKLEEAKARRSRSIFELGGRVIESWWDPTIKLEEDEDHGFQQGAVVGSVIPQPTIARMIEADPRVLACSINAYPKGARPGVAPWNPALEGALIEGIVGKPPGSVDWVVRAGAGGRVLTEDEDRRPLAVSLCEALYSLESSGTDNPRALEEEMSEIDFKTATPQAIKEWFRRERSDADEIIESGDERITRVVEGLLASRGFITEDFLEECLTEARRLTQEDLVTAISESSTDLTSEVDRLVESRAQAQDLAALAHQLIESADNLPGEWKADLKRKFVVLPSGPSDTLLLESDDTSSAEDKLRESVKEHVDHAVKLIRAANPGAAVTGQGGAGGELREGATAKPTLPKKEDSVLLSLLTEGREDADSSELLAQIGKGIR